MGIRRSSRYTQGVWTTDHRRLDEVGPIVSARVVGEQDQITVITANGIILRTPVSGISRMGRSTRGVRVVNLQSNDSVAALAVLTYDDLTRGIDNGSENGEAAADAVGAPVEALDGGAADEILDEALDAAAGDAVDGVVDALVDKDAEAEPGEPE